MKILYKYECEVCPDPEPLDVHHIHRVVFKGEHLWLCDQCTREIFRPLRQPAITSGEVIRSTITAILVIGWVGLVAFMIVRHVQ